MSEYQFFKGYLGRDSQISFGLTVSNTFIPLALNVFLGRIYVVAALWVLFFLGSIWMMRRLKVNFVFYKLGVSFFFLANLCFLLGSLVYSYHVSGLRFYGVEGMPILVVAVGVMTSMLCAAYGRARCQ